MGSRATPIKIGPQSMHPCPRPVWQFQRLRGKAVKISHVPGTQTQGIPVSLAMEAMELGSFPCPLSLTFCKGGLPSCSAGAIMLYMGHVTDMVVAVVLQYTAKKKMS